MTIGLLPDNKVKRNPTGEVVDNAADDSDLLLSLDSDIQQPWWIFKNGSNLVKQVTDKANNLPFFAQSGNEYTYNYDGYFTRASGQYSNSSKNLNADLSSGYFFEAWVRIHDLTAHTNLFRFENTYGFTWYVYPLENMFKFRYIDATGSKANTGIPISLLSEDEWFHFAAQMDNVTKKMHWYLNGTCVRTSTSPTFIVGNINDIHSFMGHSAVAGAGADVKNIRIYKKPLYSTDHIVNDVVFNPKEPFFYYKRYPNKDGNKKTYFNTRYLKDTIIDVNNKIERLYSELGTSFLEQTTPANQPTHTNKGILFASGEALTQASSDDYLYGTDDFTIGKWVDFQNESVVFEIGSGVITFGLDATNAYIETSGGKLYATRNHATSEGYKYMAMHREGANIFFTIGGIYENTRAEAIDYNSNQSAQLGGLFIGYSDELLNVKSALWTFAGKSSLNKVFEPPRRRSLNSEIIQY